MPNTLNYPGPPPGPATATIEAHRATLENAAIRCEWQLDWGRVVALTVTNRHTSQQVSFDGGGLPCIALAGGGVIDLAKLTPIEPLRSEAGGLVAEFDDAATGLHLRWAATLADNANAVIQSLTVTASADTAIAEWVFADESLPGAEQVGRVDGSVVVCGDVFLAIEHPLAHNAVDADRVRCALPHPTSLGAQQPRTHRFAIGVTPPGQRRRGFAYYVEQRRAHPYRPFLHYNNWYDVYLGRPMNQRATEAGCLETIAYFGRELVEKRSVQLDAFVWDDGWDDFNTLWDFHDGFPNGFAGLIDTARRYDADQGVWLSPNGGYADAKERRIAYGRPLGYETNERGFAMAGPNYARAFRESCLRMIRDHGVVFFKFDGMGSGGSPTGAEGEYADDIQAILDLSRALHDEKPGVFVSATCGTWASPFWVFFADSVWRQGGDSGHHGKGDTRQQWLNYRDKYCFEHIVQRGPLYPLNSLMLHGVLIGNRPNRAPSGMALDEKSVADEAWSFFGSGTCVQELYISPNVMTDTMLDQLAAAAKWARANAGTLIDTHWVGGNPGEGEAYGWASWQPGKGIITLRNPDDAPQAFTLTLREALELTDDAPPTMTCRAVYPADRALPTGPIDVGRAVELELAPFETLVMELQPAT